MTSGPIDTAYVQIVPDFGNFSARVQAEMNRITQRMQSGITQSMGRATRTIDQSGQRMAATGATLTQRVLHPLRNIGNQAQTTGGQVRGATTRMAAGFSGLNSHVGVFSRIGPRAMTLFATGLAGVGVAAGIMGTRTTAMLEQANISFAELLGSGVKAQGFLKDLSDFAAKTPFELPGLIGNARSLLGVGQAAKDVIPIMRALGDASGALGLDQEHFNRIMLATTQSMAKGKIQGEELLQFIEAGIPIWDLLSKSTGKSTDELRKMSERGELLAEEVLPGLFKQMEKDYGGAMSKQAQTLNGIWSTLMDTINLGLAGTLQPLVPFMKDALTGAIAVLREAFEALPGIISTVAPVIGGFFSLMTGTWIPMLVTFGTTFLEDFIPVDAIADKFAEVKQIVDDFLTGLRGGFKPIRVGSMIEDPTPSEAGKLGQTLRDLFAGGLTRGLEQVDWGRVGAALGAALVTAVEGLGRVSAKIGDALVNVLGDLDWFQLGREVGLGAFSFAIGFVQEMFTGVLRAFKEHPFETILGIVMIVPIGKLAGLIAKAVAKIPVLRAFAPLLRGVESLGGLVQKGLGLILTGVGRFFGALGRGFLIEMRKVFPTIGKRFGEWLGLLPTRLGLIAIRIGEIARGIPGRIGRAILAGAEATGRAMGRLIAVVVTRFRGIFNLLAGLVGFFPDLFTDFQETALSVFRGVGIGLAELAKAFIRFGKFAFDAIWNFVLAPLNAMLDVMSKLPFGMGKPFEAAKNALSGFKDSVDDAFNGAIDKVDDWERTLKNAPKVAKLTGDIKDLDQKLAAARRELRDPELTKERRAKLNADIADLLRRKRAAQDAIDRLKGKTVSIDARLGGFRVPAGVNVYIKSGVIGFQEGGKIPGPPSSKDNRLIGAASGEYLVNARQTAAHLPLLEMINAGKVPTFQAGGLIGSLGRTDRYYRATAVSLGAGLDRLGDMLFPAAVGGAGVARWSNVVRIALAMLHQPASLLSAVLSRMQRESGGNPLAVNRWDSNWIAGHPSVGLMQVIGPTFRAYAGGFRGTGPFLYGTSVNPTANVFAGLNYALHRYPSLLYAMLKPGGYAAGTPFVPETGMYELHRGERVIPAGQNRAGWGAPITVNNEITVNAAPGMDEQQLAELVRDEVDEGMTDLLRELTTGVRR